MKQQPQLEYISQPDDYYNEPLAGDEKGFFSSRLKIFMSTFAFCLIFGLIINYSRPAVYQSSATLLTSAATAIDQVSSNVDFQQVAIQKQKLLSFELLAETLKRVKETADNPSKTDLTIEAVRSMLTVAPIEQTNLLSMTAHGPEPEILPVIINTWIDVYLKARALSVADSTQGTVELVRNELDELDSKVEQAQTELDRFRKENDISSVARDENESLTKLKGLTRALNDANEDVVRAKAKLDAVNEAIAKGQTVVPNQEQRSLNSLERRYQELKEKLAEFDKRYTREYLDLQPSLKFIPEQIEKLEKEIRNKRQVGQQIVWTEANQDYYAAKQVAAEIRQQLDEHKKKAANFTTLFSQHEKLVDDLASLEKMQRETRDRLVKIESKHFEKYPQVDVVDRASVNYQAISPNYNRGALIAVVSALVIAFFTVWTYEFLTQARHKQNHFVFPMQAWFGHASVQEHLERQREKVIEQKSHSELPRAPRYQKLTERQIQSMLVDADSDTELLILFLMSGLTLQEIVSLDPDQIDAEFGEVLIGGRRVKLGQRLLRLLKKVSDAESLWSNGKNLKVEEAQAMLYCTMVDSGLTDLNIAAADALRQTYIIYLVEQGVRLTALAKIVGALSPLELVGYAEFSSSEEGRVHEEIDVVHPICYELPRIPDDMNRS